MTQELEAILDEELIGLDLDLALRTRSTVAKAAPCRWSRVSGTRLPSKESGLGFASQNLDVYVQLAGNVQIWNEEVDVASRFVLVRPDSAGQVVAVRALTGHQIAQLDRTGTLTSKYQPEAEVLDVTAAVCLDSERFIGRLPPPIPGVKFG